jgi:AraC-like DNA-binding protein
LTNRLTVLVGRKQREMDVISEILAVSGVRGARPARVEARGVWGVNWRKEPLAGVYAVMSGSFWLGVSSQPVRRVDAGDIVMLPTGIKHSLSSGHRAALVDCDPEDALRASRTGQALRFGDDGEPDMTLLAASYRHDGAVRTQLLPLLPTVVHLKGDRADATVGHTVRLLGSELSQLRIGTSVAIDRIVDILLVQMIRSVIDAPDAAHPPSILSAVRDPVVAEALQHLHADPARAWTVELLAGQSAVSRATLIRRFAAALGEPVGAYLSRWRMDLASLRLRDTGDSLETVARLSGYQSAAAFSRAFKQSRGVSPGQFRRNSQAVEND